MTSAVPAPGSRPRWPVDRGAVLQWAIALFTGVLVLAPLVPVILQSLMAKPLYDGVGAFTADNYVAAASPARPARGRWAIRSYSRS